MLSLFRFAGEKERRGRSSPRIRMPASNSRTIKLYGMYVYEKTSSCKQKVKHFHAVIIIIQLCRLHKNTTCKSGALAPDNIPTEWKFNFLIIYLQRRPVDCHWPEQRVVVLAAGHSANITFYPLDEAQPAETTCNKGPGYAGVTFHDSCVIGIFPTFNSLCQTTPPPTTTQQLQREGRKRRRSDFAVKGKNDVVPEKKLNRCCYYKKNFCNRHLAKR